MFDIGWPELLVVAIVLIVVVGPKDLPRMLRTFGRTTGKLRAMAGDFRRQFDEALKEAELDDVKSVIDTARSMNPTNDIKKHLNPLQKAGDEIKSSLDDATKPAQPAPAKGGEPATTAVHTEAPAKSGAAALPGEKTKTSAHKASEPLKGAEAASRAVHAEAPAKAGAAAMPGEGAKPVRKPAAPKSATRKIAAGAAKAAPKSTTPKSAASAAKAAPKKPAANKPPARKPAASKGKTA